MTINLSTPIKYIASIGVTALLVAATIYADEITTLSQTAKSGDKITHEWVNAVSENSKVSAASNNNYFCVAATKANLLNYGSPTSISYINSIGDKMYFYILNSTHRINIAQNYGYDVIEFSGDNITNSIRMMNDEQGKLCYGAR